jgi:hypothetical protein
MKLRKKRINKNRKKVNLNKLIQPSKLYNLEHLVIGKNYLIRVFKIKPLEKESEDELF